MSIYLTVFDETTTEYVEKRSKFIATLRHCENEEEAQSFIEEMRSKYWDATHNCFAYCVDKGRNCRFSDDGEPHGTAGKPMLDVIVGSEIKNIAVVVTRYFGGTLLGTGGLVRAYSKATKDVINEAEVYEMIPCTVFATECEYSDHQKLVSIIENSFGKIENTEFYDKVKVTYCFKTGEEEAFLPKIQEAFSARLEPLVVENRISAFKFKKIEEF